MGEREPKFEALVYTGKRELAAQCARAFADFPVDWVMLYESSLALDYLSKHHFDYIILDLDSVENCSTLIDAVRCGANLKSIVLAVTSVAINPSILDLCYVSRVFYPIRPSEIEEQLYRTVPLAERFADERWQQIEAVPQFDSEGLISTGSDAERISPWFRLRRHLGPMAATLLGPVLNFKHSLSIKAQERTASLIASIGTVWFVQELTADFRGVQSIQPPSAGPTYLIMLAVLLWLCAKQRRALA